MLPIFAIAFLLAVTSAAPTSDSDSNDGFFKHSIGKSARPQKRHSVGKSADTMRIAAKSYKTHTETLEAD
jgi:hypothetical protein